MLQKPAPLSNAERAQRFRDRHPGYNARYRRRANIAEVKRRIAAAYAHGAAVEAALATEAAAAAPTPASAEG